MRIRREEKILWTILAVALSLNGSTGFCQQIKKVSPKGTQFLIYTPPGYPSDGQYPLLLSLHGLGGMGTDLDLLLTHKDQIPAKLIAQNTWPSDHPFIVVTPQLKRDESISNPKDQEWPPEVVDEVVEYVKSGYAVNDRKIYVTGLSLGAHGSYTYAAAYPSKVAAAVIISGAPDSTLACQVKDIPLWVFHGSDDDQVWPVFPQGVIRTINDCSPPAKFRPRLDLFYGQRHEGWDQIYNNSSGYNVFEWMLKFTKNDPANTPPYVNAGHDLTIAHRDQPIYLYGEFFDSDGTIASAIWSKVNGPAVKLDETGSHFLKLSNYTPGTYEFQLRVTDNSGAQGTDRVVVNIVPQNSGGIAVTGLSLINATNDQTVASIYDGYVVNPQILNTNRINIQATASGNPGSIRFQINGSENNTTLNNAPYLLASKQWTVEAGEYLVCATPYSGKRGTGNAGIAQCFKIIVSTEATSPPPPEEPEEPEEPEQPEEPEEPEEPVEPEEPEEPVEPEEPEEPVEPEEPEEPVEPEQPEEPEEPVEPEEPEEPEEPGEPVAHFYAKPGADLSLLSSWSSNPEGTGTAPASFSTDGQVFDVQTQAVLNSALAIGGTGSVFRIRTGGELVLNGPLDAAIHMEPEARLQVNTAHPVSLGTLHAASVVHLNANATAVPMAQFGHLNLNGDGSLKTLASGVTHVAGNLTIGEGVMVERAANASGVLSLSGDLNMTSKTSFMPAKPFSIIFGKPGSQTFSLGAARAAFQEIVVRENTIVRLTGADGDGILELGSPSGGGLTVGSGGKLLLDKRHLAIREKGTVNPGNETGAVGFRKASLEINSSTGSHLNLYTIPGMDSLSSLIVNLTGTGNLNLKDTLYVVNEVNLIGGITASNGNLTLVSTSSNTARVVRSEQKGMLSGNVVFQRFIEKGDQTRYVSLPVAGVTVRNLQAFIPVTGSFNGASTGEGLSPAPSLFSYNETSGGWVPFPEENNGEIFEPGRGYALSLHDGTTDKKVSAAGHLHQGDFSYGLTPNANNDPDMGWNLIGNPYASAIAWGEDAWNRKGVGTAAYVLDDRYAGGRFLVWDGDTGDPEFSGVVTQGQGFFVRITSDAPMLTVTEDAWTDTASALWRLKKNETIAEIMTVTLKQNNLIDRTYLKFSPEGDHAFEPSDAVKRRNGYFSLSTLSSDSVSLAINHLDEAFCDRSIGLMVDTGTPGQYTLVFEGGALSHAESQVTLADDFTGKITRLHEGAQYTFQVTTDPVSSGKKRFRINISSATTEDPAITVAGNVLTSNVTSGNQWLLNGEEIDGATATTYTPEVTGEYSLQVSRNGCILTSAPVLITVTVTGIMEFKNREVTVYPNPASDRIRIHLQSGLPGRCSYSIANMLGRRVAAGEMEPEKTPGGAEINISQLPPGVYLLNLRAGGGNFQGKFVVDPRSP